MSNERKTDRRNHVQPPTPPHAFWPGDIVARGDNVGSVVNVGVAAVGWVPVLWDHLDSWAPEYPWNLATVVV